MVRDNRLGTSEGCRNVCTYMYLVIATRDPCDDRSCEIWGRQMRLAKKVKSPPTTGLGVGDEVMWTPATCI